MCDTGEEIEGGLFSTLVSDVLLAIEIKYILSHLT